MKMKTLPFVPMILWLSIVVGCGSSEPSGEDIINRKDLTDVQAIRQVAKIKFLEPKDLQVTKEDDGVLVVVTMNTDKDGAIYTIKGTSPAEINENKALKMSVLAGRGFIKLARERNLQRLEIKLQQTLQTADGKTQTMDVFGYSVSKERFDEYLTVGNTAEVAKGGARETIENSSEVLYDRFDEIEYRPAD